MRIQSISGKKALPLIVVSIAILLCLLFTGVSKVRASEMQNGRVTYQSIRIEEGDSLWSISARYGADDPQGTAAFMKKVASLNQIGMDATIHTGNYLLVPVMEK